MDPITRAILYFAKLALEGLVVDQFSKKVGANNYAGRALATKSCYICTYFVNIMIEYPMKINKI